MRDFEEQLRVELRRTEPVLPVSGESMLARVARARRRRSVGVGVAAAGCAVLVVTAIVPLFGRGASDAATPRGPRILHTVDVINVVFHDRSHGYALQQRCAQQNPDVVASPRNEAAGVVQAVEVPPPTCRISLVKTADGGQTWQERPVPVPVGSEDSSTGSMVGAMRGHSRMLWAPEPGTLALGTNDRRYWTSTDGGETWNEAPEDYDLDPPGKVFAFDYDDRHAFLTEPKEPMQQGLRPGAASDGSYWLSCVVGSCVQVTRDLGETWQTLKPAENEPIQWLATADGRTVYVTTGAKGNSEPLTLLRSADGGATWQPLRGTVPESFGGLALPSGDLLTLSARHDGDVHRIAAGTSTPVKIPGVPGDVHTFYLTAGVVVLAGVVDLTPIDQMSEDPSAVAPAAWISADDGASFTPIPPPAPLSAS